MKVATISHVFSWILLFCFPTLGLAQGISITTPDFVVKAVEAPVTITSADLAAAENVADLNPRFPTDWVKKYNKLAITVAMDANTATRFVNDGFMLSAEQKKALKNAPRNTAIFVHVYYLPENNLSSNSEKEIEFEIQIKPDIPATFPGGTEAMNAYFTEKAIAPFKMNALPPEMLVGVEFTITGDGFTKNVHVLEPSHDPYMDNLLLETVQNMPPWDPAKFENGTRADQTFVLAIGNMESCTYNLLGKLEE